MVEEGREMVELLFHCAIKQHSIRLAGQTNATPVRKSHQAF